MPIARIDGRIGRVGGRILRAPHGPVVYDYAGGAYGAFRSFARVGAGTAFRADGTLAEFASGVARITDRGLLLEAAATNLCLYFSPTVTNLGVMGRFANAVAPPNTPHPDLTWIKRTPETGSGSIYAYGRTGHVGPATVIASIIVATPDDNPPNLGASSANELQIGADVGSPTFSPGPYMVESIGPRLWRCWNTITSAEVGNWYGPSLLTLPVQNVSRDLKITGYQLELELGQARPSSPIITTGASATRGADEASLTVPPGCTSWTAVYGDADTEVGGSGLTPGQPFDLVDGRPWIGVGNELRRLEFLP